MHGSCTLAGGLEPSRTAGAIGRAAAAAEHPAARVLSLTASACMSRLHSHSHSSAVRMAAPVAASAMAAPHMMQPHCQQPQPPLGPAAAPQTPLSRTQLIQVRLAASSRGSMLQSNATPSSTVNSQLNATDVAAVAARVAARLPTAAWAHLLPEADGGSIQVAELDMRHGTLSPIQVRVIQMSSNGDQSSAAGAVKNDEAAAVDQSLGWLLQSLRVNSPAGRPLLGLAYKSSSADKTACLLQLSTVDRCVLISLPSSAAELRSSASGATASSQPAPRTPFLAFTDTLRQVLARDDVIKVCVGAGETMWNLWHSCGLELNGCVELVQGGGADPRAALQYLCDAHLGQGAAAVAVDVLPSHAQWSCRALSLQQTVSAALEAQLLCTLAHRLPKLPSAVHLRDVPQSWLARARQWSHLIDAAGISASSTALLVQRYIAQVVAASEPFNPFCHSLLGLPFPSIEAALASMPPSSSQAPTNSLVRRGDALVDRGSLGWTWRNDVERNIDQTATAHPGWRRLDADQLRAMVAMDRSRISLVEGKAGTGKSALVAVSVMAALTRSSSIHLDPYHPHLQTAPQRILCVCATDEAARHLAECIAELLPSQQLLLVVTPTFFAAWNPEQLYLRLRCHGYVHDPQAVSMQDRVALVCSADALLGGHIPSAALLHRQTVVVDSAHTMGLLQVILLLRQLPHTERLLLFGDEAQSAGHQDGQRVESVWTAAHASLAASHHQTPPPFRATLSRLTQQHRLPPHLERLVSSLFYGNEQLSSHQLNPSECARAVTWMDVPFVSGAAKPGLDGGQGEIDTTVRLWNHYAQQADFTMDDIAILCVSSSQRERIRSMHEEMHARIFGVREFEGQQARVILLLLGSAELNEQLEDCSMLCVAMSRATASLFIVGDRASLLRSTAAAREGRSMWNAISEYERKEVAAALGAASVDSKEQEEEDELEESHRAEGEEEAEPVAEAHEGCNGSSAQLDAPPPVEAAQAAAAASPAPAVSPPQQLRTTKPLPAFRFVPMPRRHALLHCSNRLKTQVCMFADRCRNGDNCPMLHEEFWRRQTQAEWWLLQVGSRCIFVEKSRDMSTERSRLLQVVLDSTRNKQMRRKHEHEFRELMPPMDAQTVTAKAPATVPAKEAPVQSASASSSCAAPNQIQPQVHAAEPPATRAASTSSSVPDESQPCSAASFTFEPMISTRAWKVERCFEFGKPGGCRGAEQCGFLHAEYWIRRSATEAWLCNPGSTLIYTDPVHLSRSPIRLEQLHSLVNAPHNISQRAKYGHELIALFPSVEAARGEGDPYVGCKPPEPTSSSIHAHPAASSKSSPAFVPVPVTVPEEAFELDAHLVSALGEALSSVLGEAGVPLSGLDELFFNYHEQHWADFCATDVRKFVRARPAKFELRHNGAKSSDDLLVFFRDLSALQRIDQPEFRLAPARLWKLEACYFFAQDKSALSEGQASKCTHPRCSYLHDEFWVQADATTYWLVTPGSSVIHTSAVAEGDEKRARQMRIVTGAERNRVLRAKFEGIIAHLLPPRYRRSDASGSAASSSPGSSCSSLASLSPRSAATLTPQPVKHPSKLAATGSEIKHDEENRDEGDKEKGKEEKEA